MWNNFKFLFEQHVNNITFHRYFFLAKYTFFHILIQYINNFVVSQRFNLDIIRVGSWYKDNLTFFRIELHKMYFVIENNPDVQFFATLQFLPSVSSTFKK